MSDKRHLLCVYPWLTWGGADKFNLDMIGCLAARGWHISIATSVPSQHEWRAQFARVTDDITDLAATPPDEAPARLLQIVQSRPISSVLVSNSHFGYQMLPYLHAHAPQLAYVDYSHVVEGNGNFARISVEQARWLDRQIVTSQDLKRWMVERGGDEANITVCTINVDPEQWNPQHFQRNALRAALGLPQDAVVALYAARLERQKQPLLALQVMHDVVRRVPNAHFLVAGDGRFGNYVRGFVRWHGLENRIHLLGAVSSARVHELLAASDLFFLPSAYEGISLAIYEAMAMGVVPISVASGGQAELVTPECGVLVERGPREAAHYTQALLALLGDPARRDAMGQAARQRVNAHFQLEQMGERMHTLLVDAQTHHHPTATITSQAALAAAQRAVATLRADSASHAAGRGANAYTQLIERGPWWVAPLAERLRQGMR